MNKFRYYCRIAKKMSKTREEYELLKQYLEMFLEQRKGDIRIQIINRLLESEDYAYSLTKKICTQRTETSNSNIDFHLRKLLEYKLISKRPGTRYKQKYFINKNFNYRIFIIVKQILNS